MAAYFGTPGKIPQGILSSVELKLVEVQGNPFDKERDEKARRVLS